MKKVCGNCLFFKENACEGVTEDTLVDEIKCQDYTPINDIEVENVSDIQSETQTNIQSEVIKTKEEPNSQKEMSKSKSDAENKNVNEETKVETKIINVKENNEKYTCGCKENIDILNLAKKFLNKFDGEVEINLSYKFKIIKEK